jgi:hypothetical protein
LFVLVEQVEARARLVQSNEVSSVILLFLAAQDFLELELGQAAIAGGLIGAAAQEYGLIETHRFGGVQVAHQSSAANCRP